MANRLALTQSSPFRPAPRETLFCETLVVGDAIAAYTATLAILQSGGQVCWVQPGKANLSALLPSEHWPRLTAGPQSPKRWQRGAAAATVTMSRSQNQFWRNWATPTILPAPQTANALQTEPIAPDTAKGIHLQQAIATYLSNQQLFLIPHAQPLRVLYSENRGQRRVFQVVFQDPQTGQRFQVHARYTLDATRTADLQRLLATTIGATLTPRQTLTAVPTPIANSVIPFHAARGPLPEDAIGLIHRFADQARPHPKVLSLSLRALMLQQLEGLLCVSHPGCEATLKAVIQHPWNQWTLGEAAGYLVAWSLAHHQRETDWLSDQRRLRQLQLHLVRQGLPLFAFDDLDPTDPDFEAVQISAIANVVRTTRQRDLSFRPNTPVTRSVLASALTRLPGHPPAVTQPMHTLYQDVPRTHWACNAIQQVTASGLMPALSPTHFGPSRVVSRQDLWQAVRSLYPPEVVSPSFPIDDAPTRRRHLVRALYPILQARLGL